MKKEVVRDEAVRVAAKVEASNAKVAKAVESKVDAVKAETDKATKAAKEETAKVTKAAKEGTTKVTKAATKAVKKVAKKPVAPKTDIYLQFADREYTNETVIKMVKEVWTKQMKKKIGDMKTLQIYVKPEEFAAYYVINGDVVGRVEL